MLLRSLLFLAAKLEEKGSWEDVYVQEAVVTLTIIGRFDDVGLVAGEADVGDVMQYTADVTNAGSVTLVDVGECSACLAYLRVYPTANDRRL